MIQYNVLAPLKKKIVETIYKFRSLTARQLTHIVYEINFPTTVELKMIANELRELIKLGYIDKKKLVMKVVKGSLYSLSEKGIDFIYYTYDIPIDASNKNVERIKESIPTSYISISQCKTSLQYENEQIYFVSLFSALKLNNVDAKFTITYPEKKKSIISIPYVTLEVENFTYYIFLDLVRLSPSKMKEFFLHVLNNRSDEKQHIIMLLGANEIGYSRRRAEIYKEFAELGEARLDNINLLMDKFSLGIKYIMSKLQSNSHGTIKLINEFLNKYPTHFMETTYELEERSPEWLGILDSSTKKVIGQIIYIKANFTDFKIIAGFLKFNKFYEKNLIENHNQNFVFFVANGGVEMIDENIYSCFPILSKYKDRMTIHYI